MKQRELISVISDEIKKLDKVSDIEETDPTKVAVEVMARKLAREKLENILLPLTEVKKVAFNNKEYTV